MFDHLYRELSDMQGTMQLAIQIEIDERGYLDRSCPSSDCSAAFKIRFDDWETIVSDDSVYCPRCGYADTATEWNTPDQQEYIQRAALNQISGRFDAAMERGARDFNSRQNTRGFLTMRMSYRPNSRTTPLPARAAEVMTQEYQCEHCRCRYASIGAAFFCPACGENAALKILPNTLKTTKNTVAGVPAIRQTIEDISGKDAAADSIRHILETQLVKVVASFQKYAEELFSHVCDATNYKLSRNVFQRIREADKLWRNATSSGYSDILSPEEYGRLIVYFQQRHLLEHQDGFVDEDYVSRSGDRQFSAGRRLVVSENNVLELVEVVEKLYLGLPKP